MCIHKKKGELVSMEKFIVTLNMSSEMHFRYQIFDPIKCFIIVDSNFLCEYYQIIYIYYIFLNIVLCVINHFIFLIQLYMSIKILHFFDFRISITYYTVVYCNIFILFDVIANYFVFIKVLHVHKRIWWILYMFFFKIKYHSFISKYHIYLS